MIKIAALNNELEEESGSEDEVTREALEQIALQQYAKSLDLQRKGNLKDATQLLKDLLDTELLYDVKKPGPGEKIVGPLFNLKYLSYKNLAAMLSESDEIDAAIEAYCTAAELDDTDITLWHRLGQLCIRAKRYGMALHSFQRGAERNPKHWPCLDKIVTLLLGLNYKEECISTIHDTLLLDPGYLRGLAYRKHIYTAFPYIRDFMEYLNPIYKWNENDDEDIDQEQAQKLIKEADDIHEIFLAQQKADQFKYKLPDLKLKKPITDFSWHSVGDSLVNMHHYMTENYFSHACFIELVFEKQEKEEPMEVCEESQEVELVECNNKEEKDNTDTEKNSEIPESESETNNLSDKEKTATDAEKVESDVEIVPIEPTAEAMEVPPEPKKKTSVRRRGSDLVYLQQWGWCTKRRSGRKKTVNRQDRINENIYDTLRRMVPTCLSTDTVENKENKERAVSPDTKGLEKLFDENSPKKENKAIEEYFNTENEQKDVKQFITKYTESKRDIIDMLKEFLSTLASKWRVKWPEALPKIFIEANNCYNNHIDVPTCTDQNKDELIHHANVNILVEEFSVNEKLNSELKHKHELSSIEAIGITLYLKPHIFTGVECLELILRQLWVKLHIHILNKDEEFGLDCLYQLLCEFEAMGEHQETYSLDVVNFTFKPAINEAEILANIKFLERNKKLSTVMDLFDRGSYEEVLDILINSFEHCKTMARNEEEEVSLDLAVQMSLILDTYWALNQVESCFKWSLICLNEALKHYFRYTSGSPEYDKWTLTVVKILCSMEHILTSEGLSCLDTVPHKELSQGLENLIRVIGHQVETNATEMPLGSVIPWIIMHYILQREEDQGRGRFDKDKDPDEVPNPLLVLFIAHEQLGNRGWCCKSEAKLLYFVLDTVVPLLRTPALSKCLEQVNQYMEQCVYCLFGHPGKKTKLKYLLDHNVVAHTLNWERAQQVYEIFRPLELPALEVKQSCISPDTELLFRNILALLPAELDPHKYVADVEKYIKGMIDKLPKFLPLMPFKMRDIYFLLGDYYLKKEEHKTSIKYNILDVIVNNDRSESWAEISLAKTVHIGRVLNSCKKINNDRDVLNPAKSIITCFRRALELDPTHCNMWIEYGIFVYTIHSFCSRLLKQASESLSMEDFESLEKQKEDLLDTTHKCFMTVLNDLNSVHDDDKANEDSWLHYYMLGKVAEKRNKPPLVYLDYYLKGVKSLHESNATYPLKINYNSPTHLCIEVLELHYRIHSSILKYIEQHENKPISASVGKVFTTYIDEWKNGPFGKKPKKEGVPDAENSAPENKIEEPVQQAANILKRSISDAGEEESHEAKRLKLEAAAAKVRRSASYDTERLAPKEASALPTEVPNEITETMVTKSPEEIKEETPANLETLAEKEEPKDTQLSNTHIPLTTENNDKLADGKMEVEDIPPSENKDDEQTDKKEDSSSSSSSSSSDSSSSDSSSSSSGDSSKDSTTSTNSNDRPLTDDELMKIVSACLDSLEDCASRFPPHYKAIYRVAHYHFYYKKGKDIARCRDLLLSNFTSRTGQKLGGLFSERKQSNFFNNIWKIPLDEVDRAGGFTFHMNRSILLTMEILKEFDDHKTLLDLSMQLQRIPEPDKTYLRDSDREELAQQAFSLCVQSLKGQLTKFSQQADLKSNDVEQQALKSLMLDIYRAYQRAQKQPNSKQFTNLLIEAFKLLTTDPITENMNLVDLSMKYCQRHIQQLRYEATLASIDKNQKQAAKQAVAEATKVPKAYAHPSTSVSQTKAESKLPTTSISAAAQSLPKMSAQDISTAFQNYLPMLNDPLMSQQTAAALSLSSYLNNISAGYSSLQNSFQSSLQNSLQNSFQAEFYRQFLGQTFSSYLPPPAKKQKRGPKTNTQKASQLTKPSKPYTSTAKPNPSSSLTNIHKSTSLPSGNLLKATPASKANPQKSLSMTSMMVSQKPASTSMTKSSSTSTGKSTTLAPSMGTVLSNLPASMTANLTSYGAPHSHTAHTSSVPTQAHMSSASTVNAAIHTKPLMPHQQVSPGKTLQEKLAERQKHLPKPNAQEINASISKLPSSLTITKTKHHQPAKKPDIKKTLPFSNERPQPISSDEVIVLDDD